MIELNNWTAKELERLEKRVTKIYKDASIELLAKSKQYFNRYQERWEKEHKAFMDGKYTEEQFKMWEYSQFGRGEHWEDLKNQMADRLQRATTVSADYVNGRLPGIYTRNNNGIAEFAQESAMKQGAPGLRFDLVDEYTVRRLMMGSREVRPYKPIELDLPKHYRFNRTKIQNALLQGILQGDSIDKIATRFEVVANINRGYAIMTARTAVTGASNAGKLARYKDLTEQGCKVYKMWISAHDTRVRIAHEEAETEYGSEDTAIPEDEPFVVDGEELMYPGDPIGSAFNICNCRCTMQTVVRFQSVLSDEDREDADIGVYEDDGILYRNSPSAGPSIMNMTKPLEHNAKKAGLEKIVPKKYRVIPSEAEIINYVAQDDNTNGSCFSSAFAYIGNKAGYRVKDFKGGKSCDFFADFDNIRDLFSDGTVWYEAITSKNDVEAVSGLLSKMERGKEYCILTSGHTAIVKNVGDQYKYLELQRKEYRGFHNLTPQVLIDRFKCKKNRSKPSGSVLIETKTLYNNDKFISILSYINSGG